MWNRFLALGIILALGACTLPQAPDPVTTTVFLPAPIERVEVTLLPSLTDSPASVTPVEPPLPTRTPRRTRTPLQIVAEAQKAARVLPTAHDFYGTSAEVTYAWQPGKVFQVYLSMTQATVISLPRGETLATGLYLDPEAYEVKNTRLGGELTGYDVITIRALKEQGEQDSFLLGDSGKKYLLHLSTGKIAMLAVTFETPQVTQAAPEPHLILPRPPQ